MSKNIAISDDVYRELKREKGDRSFSDVIRKHLEERRKLAERVKEFSTVRHTRE
nr:antitoxin VapB family protein [Halovivax sp. TS33]